ncbi:MAG TPA: type II toxin-antitoxin system HipA family toxin [Phenylobacterium sp.]|nr:type II toxin-antitoxin system HipA family toxin [Phenylobacterium sp.]
MTDATVSLWGRDVGAVSWDEDRQVGVFQYMPDFAASDIELAPLVMPLSPDPYAFPALPRDAFKALPGLLADSLPDKFGNALIDAWLAGQGRSAASFNPVERLCYIGARGMGALEFKPTLLRLASTSKPLKIDALVDLANRVLAQREGLGGAFNGADDRDTINDILRVGTSAGGARAKAILAWNEATGEFRSGQIPASEGFTYWLMKFDGVTDNRDKEVADPLGFGLIEYAYHLMAVDAGIVMTQCRLHYEGGRSHFMTKRFDRTERGQKLHMQSLAALRHFDFNAAGAYSYEQALETIRRLDLPNEALEQQFRRAAFNVLARNQDDHVKNIAFLMDRDGRWRLSPAFDLSYSHNPNGLWTNRHQMSVNGKLDGFERSDLLALGETAGLKRKAAEAVVDDVAAAVGKWPSYAAKSGVAPAAMDAVTRALRRL